MKDMKEKKNLTLTREQEILCEEYMPHALRLAKTYSKKYNIDSIEDCESLALEALVKAIKTYKPYNNNSNIKAWIALVVRSYISTESRKQKRQKRKIADYKKVSINDNDQDDIICLDNGQESSIIEMILENTLKKFTEDEQQMFKEVSFNKKTLMQVGQSYNVSHTKVANILKNIREEFIKSYYV